MLEQTSHRHAQAEVALSDGKSLLSLGPGGGRPAEQLEPGPMYVEKQPGSLTKNVARAAGDLRMTEHVGRARLFVRGKIVQKINDKQSIGQQVPHQHMACVPVKMAAAAA